MSDTSSVRTASRASTLLNRPQIAPMGPRTRQSSTRTSRTFSDHGGGNVLNSLDLSEFGVRRVSSPAPSGTTPPRAPSLRAASPAPPAAPPLSVHNSNSENPPVSPMMNSFSFSPAQARKSLPVVSEPTVEEDSEPESPVQLRPESPVAEDSEDELDAPISPVQEEPDSPLPLVEPESEPELRPQPPEPPVPTAHAITQQAPAPDTEYPESPVESAPAYVEQPAPIASSSSQQPQIPKIITAPVSQPKPPPKLVPPPAIKLDTTSVEWKGLPLDAAVWTVDSVELQMIVSRAIRSSAKESFIRILTLENIDTVLPAELARLDAAKAMAQSKYRFLVHRRNMQFQALNSTALGQQKDGEDGVSVVARLAAQLSETITECEKHLEEVISINDQIAQINKLIDVHWAGALAIALRKLNGSYARRTTDLTAARERIKQLEGELEDAWKEAEKMAGELDDYEAAIAADDTEAIIEVAEVVAVPRPPSGTLNRRISTPMSPTLVAFTPLPASSPSGAISPISPASPTSSPEKHFSFPPPIHMKAKETEAEDVPDSVSIKSTRSTRSAKSARSNRSGWTADSNHTSSVHAARKRSHRASQASLRLSVGGRKVGGSRSPPEERPPVPELPLQFSSFSSRGHASAANASSIFLPLDSVHHHSTPSTPGLRRQQSLDSVITNGNAGRVGVRVPPPNPDAYRRAAADDLYVRLKSQNPGASEIQLVPRTPVPAPTFATAIGGAYSPPPSSFAPPNRKLGSMGRLGNLKAASSKIPSMWMNADAIKPPPPQLKPLATDLSIKSSSEHSSDSVVRPLTSVSAPVGTLATTSELGKDTPEVSRQRSFRNSTVSKIRGLTKRYSVSLPLFNVKAPSTSKSSHDEPRMSG